jgi:small nuclear ribonucleoprotein (snRNP)-like protein
MSRIGVPIKVLHEAVGHTVTIELKTGEVYRGTLQFTEDNMNSQLSGITFVHVHLASVICLKVERELLKIKISNI